MVTELKKQDETEKQLTSIEKEIIDGRVMNDEKCLQKRYSANTKER